MRIRGVALTPALRAWLVAAGDAPLTVRRIADTIEITRADGAELSAEEEIEVRALISAHDVEPLARRTNE